MTAVTLTPKPSDPSVLVQVTAAPATIVINRYDVNGVNPVRLLAGQAPIAGDLTVTDYEAALTGPLRYDVVSAGATIATATTTLAGTVAQPWLSVPVLPQNRVALVAVLEVSEARDQAGTIHVIINRADPIPTFGPLRLRKGTMRIWAPDYPTARTIEAIANFGEIVLLRQVTHDGLDMYFSAIGTGLKHEEFTTNGWRWFVEFDYHETYSPVAPLQGSIGWNFNALTQWGTFDAAQSAFHDFNAMLVGP